RLFGAAEVQHYRVEVASGHHDQAGNGPDHAHEQWQIESPQADDATSPQGPDQDGDQITVGPVRGGPLSRSFSQRSDSGTKRRTKKVSKAGAAPNITSTRQPLFCGETR